MKILVIEDNPDFAQLLCDIFEIKGCTALVAHTARVGLNIAETERPDMIFCDVGLPGEMSGLEFARTLRNVDELARTPLIAVTGYSTKDDLNQAINAGFDMVFPKPVKFADLSKALETYRGPAHSP